MASAATLPGVAFAQTYSTLPQPQSDADALAAAVRTLGTNPKNIDALVTAGELSMRLGDASAAAAFFARAEKLDPRNARMKAGEAALLVHEERPGEALRYFDQAVGYGIDPGRIAAERGLAYDLIGEPDRAQRDYRVALRTGGDNPEVVRRYALSLGISGKRDLALQALDPLLRQSDRGAWRARAFILAMTGDVAGAGKIATTMMPPGMATGLQPFFERLPSLPAADRAFAVHFGEVRATPQRLADARMAPALPTLGPDPTAPIEVAQQPTAPVAQVASNDTRKGKRTGRRSDRRTAQTKPSPPAYALQTVQALPGVRTSAPVSPTPTVPRTTTPGPASVPAATAQQAQTSTPTRVAAVPIPASPQVSQFSATFAQNQARWEAEQRAASRRAAEASVRAAASPAPGSGSTKPSATALANASVAPQSAVPATSTPIASSATSQPAANMQPSSTPAANASAAATSSPPVAAQAPMPAATAPQIALVTPGASTLRQPLSVPVGATPVTSAPPKTEVNAATSVTATPRTPAVAAKPPRLGDDSILAKIIANIKIPDSELAAAPRAAPVATGKATTRAVAVEPTAAEKREAAAKALADKKAAAAKKAADAKALADKKATADKKAAEEKLAKADPARVWVQVAGGANEADLAKAWKGVKGKAAALKGKSAYSTPLRATNRLVTGPFKSDEEAQAFVNTLAKQGVSAFTFTSTRGQKMTPVGGK